MADKKLNEVTKVTDMAYVPVIMADGSIGQISKADLSSVVAELIGYKVSFICGALTYNQCNPIKIASGCTASHSFLISINSSRADGYGHATYIVTDYSNGAKSVAKKIFGDSLTMSFSFSNNTIYGKCNQPPYYGGSIGVLKLTDLGYRTSIHGIEDSSIDWSSLNSFQSIE